MPMVTVVVPTLSADFTLLECIRSLARQSFRDFETIVVDNSGRALVSKHAEVSSSARIIENSRNLGFGAAINQGLRQSNAQFLATLNDDAIAHPAWLSELVSAASQSESVGLCASQVRLLEDGRIDSAGMVIAADGSSKQRGHGCDPAEFSSKEEVLLPSGSAALYRRVMLSEIGGFDETFFLYCEDTDVGLRARWAGWRCMYVPTAIVEHRYSHSAGRASALKAYYVERNRLFLIVKNFPARSLAIAPFASIVRYVWHLIFMLQGKGTASQFRRQGSSLELAWLVALAYAALIRHASALLRQRHSIRANARISTGDFAALLRQYSIPVKQVAAL